MQSAAIFPARTDANVNQGEEIRLILSRPGTDSRYFRGRIFLHAYHFGSPAWRSAWKKVSLSAGLL